MSYLRGSANYVWCTTSVLGKGATGAVFQGVSKHDGEPVAVKTFNQLSHMRPQEVQVREFEVLKKVKHENIVKLLAIEEEQDGRGKVIVMELCTGGSLFNTLDDPENAYGLQEDEFLLVLEHLSAGMKHLRDNNLVHRDLKPGNIMKFVSEDGRTIYKLTDFGAARELEEDGEFMSLYGTEEYLHPDMYERAVLRKPVGKSYSAFVDLWSIGVTLYHVATGNLPFRPFGGRKNKEMMYYIVTKKESGVISGSQTTENGAVEWKRDLPNTSQLSAGIKIFITPLLAGLMEVDPRKRWTFDNFFSAVTSLLKRRRVHIFYVNRIQSLRVYLDLEEHKTLTSFQCLVMEQTDISPENQILLYKDHTLPSLLNNGKKCSSDIPVTQEDSPLILCHRENNNITMDWDTKDLAKFTTFPNLVNVENDASLAKLICGVGYSYRRRIEKICRSVNLINQAVNTIIQVIILGLVQLSKDSTQVQSVISSLGQQLGMMSQFQKTCQTLLAFANLRQVPPHHSPEAGDTTPNLQEKVESLGRAAESQQEEFSSMASHLLTLEQPIKQLHHRFVENSALTNEWEDATNEVKDISRAAIKAATHVAKLRDSWQHLLRDRATRSLTYNDEQFHILERIKMGEKAKCLTDLLHEESQLVIVRLTEVLSDWYKTAQAGFIQTEILAKDMSQFEKNLQVFLAKMSNIAEAYQSDLAKLTTDIKHYEHNAKSHNFDSNPTSLDTGCPLPSERRTRENGKKSNYQSPSRKEYTKTFNRGLRELTIVQEEVWNILKENAELVNQFQTLTLSILSPDAHANHAFESSAKGILNKSESSLFGKSD